MTSKNEVTVHPRSPDRESNITELPKKAKPSEQAEETELARYCREMSATLTAIFNGGRR